MVNFFRELYNQAAAALVSNASYRWSYSVFVEGNRLSHRSTQVITNGITNSCTEYDATGECTSGWQ
ncbi:hypothetical protein D3C86_1857450 [compost metagenome]